MKFKFRQKELQFVCHKFTDKGLQVHSDKVAAIANMPKLDDVSAVRRVMGMANYFSRFIPNLSVIMEPLRQLTCKKVQWWCP